MGWNVIQQGKTSETQYSIASYDGLVTVTDALFSSITTNPNIANSITVPNVSPSGGTTLGSGARFTLTSTAGAITGITVTTPGSGYTIGTTIVFDMVTLTAAGFTVTGPNTELVITLMTGDLGTLIAVQPNPITSPPTPYATTSAFNTEGDGQGVTISYHVATATTPGVPPTENVKVVLDINNDPDVSDNLWVATDAIHTSLTGTFFVASKNSYRQVRLRVESALLPFSITIIRLMADS